MITLRRLLQQCPFEVAFRDEIIYVRRITQRDRFTTEKKNPDRNTRDGLTLMLGNARLMCGIKRFYRRVQAGAKVTVN